MLWFHGTTHDFNSFSLDRACEENFAGNGVYLTSCWYDAEENYSKIGPDLSARIECLVDELYNDPDFCDEDDESAIREAISMLHGGNSFILHCEADCKPAILDKNNPIWIDVLEYNEETEEYDYTEQGYGICSILDYFGLGYDLLESEMSLLDLYEIIRDNAFENWTEVFQDILIELGYDSILFKDFGKFCLMYKNWSVDHLIVFDPSKVKIVEREDLGFSQDEIEEYIEERK